MRDCLRTAAVCSLLLAGAASTAEAQDTGVARSFEELVGRVHPGDTVSVIDTTSTEVSGRIERVSDGSLALLTDDGLREWSEVDVRTIRQRRGDSLKNGALIGLGVGGALGILVVGTCLSSGAPAGCGGGGGTLAAAVAFNAGLYAAIGVGIDALIRTRHVIYDSAGSADVSLSPLVTRTRRGVLMSLSFRAPAASPTSVDPAGAVTRN